MKVKLRVLNMDRTEWPGQFRIGLCLDLDEKHVASFMAKSKNRCIEVELK